MVVFVSPTAQLPKGINNTGVFCKTPSNTALESTTATSFLENFAQATLERAFQEEVALSENPTLAQKVLDKIEFNIDQKASETSIQVGLEKIGKCLAQQVDTLTEQDVDSTNSYGISMVLVPTFAITRKVQ